MDPAPSAAAMPAATAVSEAAPVAGTPAAEAAAPEPAQVATWREAAAPEPATAVAAAPPEADPAEEHTIADHPLDAALAEETTHVNPAAEDEPTSRLSALDGPEPEDVDSGFGAGVTPSADWDDGDDCWSAPV